MGRHRHGHRRRGDQSAWATVSHRSSVSFTVHSVDMPRRYSCYQAILVIVTCYYRPLREGKELDARRTLTTALAQLAAAHPSR